MENTLKFVLSAHNGGLGKIRVTKETADTNVSNKVAYHVFYNRDLHQTHCQKTVRVKDSRVG
jgi:hypothetical protein